MLNTLLQMFALIGLGLAWSVYNPARIDSALIRKVLTDLVYYIFLPALVFRILWLAELGLHSIKIALVAAIGVFSALLLTWLICRRCGTQRRVTGAILLAAGFPNATYLGYPVLVETLGDWAGAVAIQYDLFACTPILLTLGIMLAARFGDHSEKPHPLALLIRVPALWAALLAIVVKLLGLAPVAGIMGLLDLLGSAVIPIMLFAIGLALQQGFGERRHFGTIIPVVLIQLLIMPLIVLGSALLLNMDPRLLTPVVLEAAMPSMALGVVISDRYGLNTGIYAAAVTASTFLSIATLPLWYGWLL